MSNAAETEFLERKKWTERSFEGSISNQRCANEIKKLKDTFTAGQASYSAKFKADSAVFIDMVENKLATIKLQDDAEDLCGSMRSKINFLKMDQKADKFAEAEKRWKEIREASEPLRGPVYAKNAKVQAYLKEYYFPLLTSFEGSIEASKNASEADKLSSEAKMSLSAYIRNRDMSTDQFHSKEHGKGQIAVTLKFWKEAKDFAAKFEADPKLKSDPTVQKYLEAFAAVKNDNIAAYEAKANAAIATLGSEADLEASILAKGNSGLLYNHDSVKYKITANYGNRSVQTSVNASTKNIGFFEGAVTVSIEGVVSNLHINANQGIEITKGVAKVVS